MGDKNDLNVPFFSHRGLMCYRRRSAGYSSFIWTVSYGPFCGDKMRDHTQPQCQQSDRATPHNICLTFAKRLV